MATFQKFEDLIAWQKAREINKLIHTITCRSNFSREFKFKDQINRSSGSVMDNIAEGFGRKGNSEFRNFLTIANGSLMELKSQMYRANDMGLISPEELTELVEMISEVARIIHGLILHLNRTGHNGLKFK